MSVKEKPLIDAVDKLGPLPGWLFSSPFVAVFFAILFVPVFGAVFTMFWSTLSAPNAVEIFDAAVLGAVGAMAFAAIILIGILISAFFVRDERAPRLLFVFGGFVAMALFFTSFIAFYDDTRVWLGEHNPQIWPSGI